MSDEPMTNFPVPDVEDLPEDLREYIVGGSSVETDGRGLTNEALEIRQIVHVGVFVNRSKNG
ncbi:hypothetical protein [Halorussus sp. MSC15.2]|uniref:hypothetical protein n=1 Tax=Halorussus sp. MSC15.2 TaxID=2283638 RepID=UPI0013D771A0|nr:hypothetical protein [Halorussus sp. MSC15.2]NEU58865.1 hypothetical protein [Halorussus sp. MSC15.2]